MVDPTSHPKSGLASVVASVSEAETAAPSVDSGLRSRLLDAVDAAIVSVDPAGRVTAWNHGAELLFGWTGSEAIGRPVRSLVLPAAVPVRMTRARAALLEHGAWDGQFVLTRKDGSQFPAYTRNTTLRAPGGQITGFASVTIDHTEQLQTELDLRSARDYLRAVTDSMGDGLCTLDEAGRIVHLNRQAEEMLGWTTAELAGQDMHDALHHQHPDGSVYPASDCPLVAARAVRDAARLEDETLLTRGGTPLAVQLVQTPFMTEDGVGGFVLLISDVSKRKQRERDAAGRLHDLDWIKRIRDALDGDRFVLYAQPIVEIGTNRTIQHELLIRMLDEAGELIPPAEFLGVAETYGLIAEIDRWVIRQAVRLAADGHPVELNVSAQSVSDSTLFDFVDAELRRAGADPGRLIFELTETGLLGDEGAAFAFATALGERGCGLALDDFGTGYGGFSYLKRLPLGYLKIDIEFVRDLVTDEGSQQVVQAVVALARGFGLKTVAEGVEDAHTLALLQGYGVDYAQGYHTGLPAPLDETILTKRTT
jgi:PAS domain S-box-containing protein